MVLLRIVFAIAIVRPLIFLIIGINVRRRQLLPTSGPAVIVANHNSHLDTLVLTTLFPLRMLHRIRPVAAADYFLKNRWITWFSLRILNIIPLQRGGGGAGRDSFAAIHAALDDGDIVIIFPEGSRGEPEVIQRYRSGIYHLVQDRPDVPIYPVFLHGLGKALPKGTYLLVPIFCDIFVGQPFNYREPKSEFMGELTARMESLASEGKFTVWDG
jgi:1-acyl-sn-glycerol-3-phosphate acyltransferase